MTRPSTLLVIGMALLGACDETGLGGGGTDGGGPNGSPDLASTSTPSQSFSLSLGPLTVPAGVERTQCVIKRLGNMSTMRVGTIHNVLGDVSHHLIVYRVSDTVEQPTPFDCDPFKDTLDPSRGAPLMITQKKEETLQLPPGVAFSLEPQQMIRIELHYINASAAPVEALTTTTFTSISDDAFRDEADFLFLGNPDIDLPPMSMATVGPSFFSLPVDLDGSKFFGITGHTHQYGTNVSVSIAPGAAGPDTAVYDVPNWNWSESATVYADPPFVIPSGGGFRFSCSYNNTSAAQVKFGESATKEMCFFWAYYYPSKGARVCVHSDQVPGGIDFCCPESPFCSLL